jgi:hypothetical protein
MYFYFKVFLWITVNMKAAKWMNIRLSISRSVLRPQNEVTQMVGMTVLEVFFVLPSGT